MKFTVHADAQREVDEARRYYDERKAGLGDEFAEAVEEALHRILDFPEAWSILSADVRRCLLHRFPYGIVYQINGNNIFIVAVMHLKRKPGYWEARL